MGSKPQIRRFPRNEIPVSNPSQIAYRCAMPSYKFRVAAIFVPPNLFSVPLLAVWWRLGPRRDVSMTGQLVETPRDSFMEAAQKELIAFERKEREFRKKVRQERAEELHMPALNKVLYS